MGLSSRTNYGYAQRILPQGSMSLRHLRPAPGNAFLAHELRGWAPEHPNIRYPVTFGVYRYGANLELDLTPSGLPTLLEALALPDSDVALVLDEEDGPRLGTWGELQHHGADVEVVHLPAGVPRAAAASLDLPAPLLASPEGAVPAQLGSAVAISLHDGCHGSIITPDPAVLARCLRGFLEEYIVSAIDGDADVPHFPEDAITALLEPLDVGAWYGLHFESRQRYWTLEARLHDAEREDTTHRWICEGQGGRWRSGWSW